MGGRLASCFLNEAYRQYVRERDGCREEEHFDWEGYERAEAKDREQKALIKKEQREEQTRLFDKYIETFESLNVISSNLTTWASFMNGKIKATRQEPENWTVWGMETWDLELDPSIYDLIDENDQSFLDLTLKPSRSYDEMMISPDPDQQLSREDYNALILPYLKQHILAFLILHIKDEKKLNALIFGEKVQLALTPAVA